MTRPIQNVTVILEIAAGVERCKMTALWGVLDEYNSDSVDEQRYDEHPNAIKIVDPIET